ncbi:glycosyltransferase [Saccharopolyspora sp. 6M]|uniref:glycosyltransferase n=1 Tax=Saccharopolyspora sp. 6M TaxID=2877237 RepID=UPI001CD3514A|nr:glycosyltransferase [Saccharopolyspora sp. 6M]MCA1225368.1 glycosyltransferase [Saccharopolyspora sp. 6M]
MRVVLTCLPFRSHLVPLLAPCAHALRRAGHRVAVACAAGMADVVAECGLEHLPLPRVRTLDALLRDPAVSGSPGMPEHAEATGSDRTTVEARRAPGPLTRAFAGPLAGVLADDLIGAAARWQPDLVVRECNEFGGYLAAERLGLPHAVLDIAPHSALNLPFVRGAVDEQRVRLGLDPVDDVRHSYRTLVAGVVPQEWYPPELRTARTYRPVPVAGADRLPAEFAGVPGDRPLVLAGFGTLAPVLIPELAAVQGLLVEALGRVRCTAVVALGSDPREWRGPRPGNVRLVERTPQRALLHRADLFVSHGGFGGVFESLLTGTPVVALPLFSDQPDNARRTAELGLGAEVDLGTTSPAALARVCAEVLGDRAVRDRVERMSRSLRAAPDLDALAADLVAHAR